MKTLYIPFEIHSREVTGYLYLAEQLVLSGSVDKVIIGRKHILTFMAKLSLLVPGSWFLKSAQMYIGSFLTLLKRRGFSLFLQDIESLATFDDHNRYDPFAKPPSIVSLLDLIFVSTDCEYSYLSSSSPSSNICLSGPLRLYHLQDPRYLALINHNSNDNKIPSVLHINSGTSIHYHYSGTPKSVYQSHIEQGMRPWNASLMAQWAIDSHLDFLSFLGSFAQQSTVGSVPTHFLLRPHPSENIEFLKRIVHNLPMCVSRSDDLPTQILSADYVITGSLSTTIYECILLGVKPFNLILNRTSSFYKFYKNHILSEFVTIVDSLNPLMNSIQSGSSDICKCSPDLQNRMVKYLNMSSEAFQSSLKKISFFTPSSEAGTISWIKNLCFVYLYNKIDTLFSNLFSHNFMFSYNYTLHKTLPSKHDVSVKYSSSLLVKVNSFRNSLYVISKNH